MILSLLFTVRNKEMCACFLHDPQRYTCIVGGKLVKFVDLVHTPRTHRER